MLRINLIGPLFILIVLSASATIAQQRPQPFSVAKGFPEPPEATSFEFAAGGFQYKIAGNGKGRRSENDKHLAFSLRVTATDYLTHQLYYADYEGDLLLIGEVSDGDYGMGFIARLDGSTLKLKWKRVIPAFNVGQGLLDGAYAYVTSIGFVGKVNLKSGAYAWRQDDLYRRDGAFNSFQLPDVEGNVVVFREKPYYLRKKIAVIRVHRHKGKIISIDTALPKNSD